MDLNKEHKSLSKFPKHEWPSILISILKSEFVEKLTWCYGKPEIIRVDNGQEFVSKEQDRWAYENNVILDFSRPSRPTDNPFIESFNGSFRDECLNTNWFLSLSDARAKIESFRRDYNS